MKITYIPSLGYYEDRPIKPKTNQEGKVIELDAVLELAKNGTDKTKGANGSIYPISNGILYAIDDVREGEKMFESDGCMFIDIDKTEEGDLTKEEADKIFESIKNYECWCCYAVAFSTSHKLHLYLLIPQLVELCKKYGKDFPDIYSKLTNKCTEQVINKIRVATGIPVIQDTSSNSIKQQHFLAVDDYFIQNCSFDIPKKIVKECTSKSKKTKKKEEEVVDTNFFLFDYEEPEKVDYISHTERWQLFCSLSRVFNGSSLKTEWERCARLIPEENGHTTSYYKTAPYKLDWNRKLTGDEYCNLELLRTFGYVVQRRNYYNEKKAIENQIREIEELIGSLNINK